MNPQFKVLSVKEVLFDGRQLNDEIWHFVFDTITSVEDRAVILHGVFVLHSDVFSQYSIEELKKLLNHS